jgi:pimeloyl-ACP methyl ester carboxylesterase
VPLPIVVGILAFLAALLLAAGYAGFYLALTKKCLEMPPAQRPDPTWEAREARRQEGKEAFYAMQPEDVSIRSHDGLTLKGWYLPAEQPGKKLAILVHGYTCDGPREFASMVPFYRSMGFDCLLPDHRCHGRSEGSHICFGAKEWRDMLGWANEFIGRLGEDVEVVMHGISMGAATTMLCNEHNPPPQLKCFVEDCGYTNAYEQIYLVLRRDYHLPFPPLGWACALWARLLAGWSLKRDADCLGHIDSCAKPMLFIHGAADPFVPAEMGRRLFEAFPLEKDLLLVPGAGHASAWHEAPAVYEETLRAFLANHITSLPLGKSLESAGKGVLL